jgi:DNA replication protein DnaC
MTTCFDLPEVYRDARPKDCRLNEKQAQELNLWLEYEDAPMIFTGTPGRGKTFTAASLYNQRQRKLKLLAEEDSRVINVPDFNSIFCNLSVLFHAYKQSYENSWELDKLLKNLLFPKLLILDDLGIREPSPGFADFLHLVIDQRVGRKKDLTLITTNCTSKQLSEIYGERFSSRVATGYCVKFEGEDLRKNKRSY